MGWCGGGELMEKCIDAIQENVGDPDARCHIYRVMIAAFEDEDCDTLYENLGKDPEWDRAYKEVSSQYEEYDPDSEL